MKWSFLLFSSFLCLQAIAQYPATGNKMRLGWQTTGDGLVYRGATGDTATLDPSGLNNAWMLLDTANGNLYAYRIKAWRLVSGGGGGGVTMPFDSVTFNVNETDASERELQYSEEKGYLQYGGLDSVQIPLLPGIWYVRNDTSVTIPKGTVVRATATLGASGRIKVKHMIANGTIDAMYLLGIAMQDIAVGADGYVMTQGKIRQVNTQAYSEGAVLYADVDTLGGLTQTEPTGSNLKLPIAFVVHSASNGTLAVRVSPGTYLRDLHDAYITSPASNASLYYNASESVWRDTTAAVLVADTSVFARDFQISGTTNRLAMFTGANTVGNSNIYQDSVGKIGIGINPSYKFQMFFNNGVTGVQDTLMDLYSANFYPVGVRSRVSNQIANGSYAVIGEALNGHYQENVGVYGIATKSDLSGPGANVGVKGEVSGTYNGSSTALGATYGGLFINNVRNTLSSGNFNIGLRVITDSAGTYGIYQNGFGANYFQGNVGINTTTPTAKLHINNPSSTTPALNIVSNSNVIGSTNDAVSINMQPGQVNQNNTGVRVFNTITGTSAEGNNTGIAVSLNARNSSYGVYSAVSKNWGGSSLFGEAIGVYGSATTDSPAGFSYGGYFKNDTTQGTGFGVFVQTTTPKGSGTVTPLAIQHNSTELMRVQSSGNVGIATSSPSRILHVNANSSMIIPSGATGTRPAPGASGDIRYNTTNANFEWHTGTAWREPVNAARSPAAGLANRFSKFDADGLLDTSAILIQANNRIGIFNSPAAGDSALTVTGGIRATTGVTAARFTATGSAVPTNGMYLPATNALAFSTNSTERMRISSTGNVGIGKTPTAKLDVDAGGGGLNSGLAFKISAQNSLAPTRYSGFDFNTYESAPGGVATGNKLIGQFLATAPDYSASALPSSSMGVFAYEADLTLYALNNFGVKTNSASSAYALTVNSSGETLIGTTVDGGDYKLQVSGNTKITGNVARKSPVTITAAYTVLSDDSWLICDGTATILLTLPNAASWTGREIMVKTIQPQAVNSAANDVVPIDGVAAGAGILPATDGAWCTLVSDGTNWIIMQRGN